MLTEMRRLTRDGERVPDAVMRGHRETRLEFLAGFLDADGHLTCNCFEFTQKNAEWARNVWWLARSLGLCATISPKDVDGDVYMRVHISGHTDMIPTRIPRKQARPRKQRKNATRTGFSVEPLGEGDYYGFELDGDGRFLLGDFTVTHNTYMGCAIAAALGTHTAVIKYAGHMEDNWGEHAEEVLGLSQDQIGIVQRDRCDLGRPLTFISVQSLLGRTYPPELYEQFGLLIADEVHRYGAQQWKNAVGQFTAKYRLGLTATPERSDGLEQIVEWAFGKIGHEAQRVRSANTRVPRVVQFKWRRTYDYARYCRWKRDPFTGDWKEGEPHPTKYDKVLAKDMDRNKMLVHEMALAAKTKRQILVLSRETSHRDLLCDMLRSAVGDNGISIAAMKSGMKKEQRKAVAAADVQFATYQMARDAYNAPKLDTLFFATPPGKVEQPAGRLREKDEDGLERRHLLILDPFEETKYSEGKAKKRRSDYDRLGFNVKIMGRG